ncbi:hypothetical protein OOZ63_27175 [Paucibacter sp. PLA-PC-4]|nr:hypothetical protein [Paucibacter sp. PLA-PC-4]
MAVRAAGAGQCAGQCTAHYSDHYRWRCGPAARSSLSPSVQLTGSRQEDKGVFDAASSLTENTGFASGANFGSNFNAAANALSLLRMRYDHTLTLINGRRVVDDPTVSNGSVNFPPHGPDRPHRELARRCFGV